MDIKIEISIDEEEIKEIVDDLRHEFARKSAIRIKNFNVISIPLGNASKNSQWIYYLSSYKEGEEERLSVTLKRFEKQPATYAPLKVSSAIVDIEDLSKLLERIAKIYLIMQHMMVGKKEVKKTFI